MPSLNPSVEQLKRFAERMPAGEPILMLNLLRFHDQAAYPAESDQQPCSGREAYAVYSRTAIKKVKTALAAGDGKAAQAALAENMSTIDRIADKKIIHKNQASRHKSRLAAKIKGMGAAAA